MRAKDASGRIYHIEVQTGYESRFFERSSFYSALSYTEQVKAGSKYKDVLTPVILVALANFICFPDGDDVYSWFHQVNIRSGKMAPETMEYHVFELPKLKNSENKIARKLARWLKFLSSRKPGEDPEIIELTKEDPIMARTLELEKEFLMTPSERYRYLCREADEIFDAANLEHLKEESEARGHMEGCMDVARSLLKMRLPLDQIAQASRLSVDQLRQLQG